MIPQFDRIRRAMNAAKSKDLHTTDNGNDGSYVYDIRDCDNSINTDSSCLQICIFDFVSIPPATDVTVGKESSSLTMFSCECVFIHSNVCTIRDASCGSSVVSDSDRSRDRVVETLESDMDQLKNILMRSVVSHEAMLCRISESLLFDSSEIRVGSDESFYHRFVMLTSDSLQVYFPTDDATPIMSFSFKKSPMYAKISIRDNEIRFYSTESSSLLLAVKLSAISSSKYLTSLKILRIDVSIVDIAKTDGMFPHELSKRVLGRE